MFFVSPTQHYRSSVSTLFTFPTAASQGVRTLLHFHAAVHPLNQLEIIGL